MFSKCLRVYAPRRFLSSASDIEAQELIVPGEDFPVQHDAAVRNKMLRECFLWAFFYIDGALRLPNLMTGEPDGPS